MSGYTPLFDTLLSGTLYGKWPHTGVWACLLSRVSREGLIDETPQCLAAAIGVSVETLKQCIDDFMSPDPDSRTIEADGRRLELIDPNRTWGWRVVNHAKYREKARKKAFDQTRTETGADAERKRQQRAAKSTDKQCPDVSRDIPLSEQRIATPTQSNAYADPHEVLESIKIGYPEGTFGAQNWILAERVIYRLIDAGELPDALIAAALAYREQQDAKGSTGSQYIRSPEKFYGEGFWKGPFKLPKTKADTRLQGNLASAEEFMRRTEQR